MNSAELNAMRNKGAYFSVGDLDLLIIALIFIKEFLLDFFGIGNAVNLLIIVLITITLFKAGGASSKRVLIPLVAALALMCISFIACGGEWDVALKNALRLAQLFPYGLFVSHFLTERWEFMRRIAPALLVVCNIVLLINLIVMAIQYFIPGLLVAWDSGPELYGPDVICGLFGKGSTHAVAILSSMVIVNNAVYIGIKKSGKVFIYNVLLLMSSFAVALINDNKALFLLLPLYALCFGLIVFWLSRARGNKGGSAKKYILMAVTLIVATASLYSISDWFKDLIDSTVVNSISMILNSLSGDAYVNGSNERFKQIGYALSLGSSWLFGEGIGVADFYQEGYHGFSFFGQSDYGSLIIIGGVWLYLAVVAFYTSVLSDAVESTCVVKKSMIVIIVVLLLTMSVYSQVFTQVRFGIPFLMMVASLEFYVKDKVS